MRVLLVNVDSTIPNLALCKIAVYHRTRGDKVVQIDDSMANSYRYSSILDDFGKIYVSCVFAWNKPRCDQWEGVAEIGGSGYSLSVELPPEIDKIKPHINMGFCTRGCIRKCSFCVVPQKEGKVREVGDIYDLWDGKAKGVCLMDNNILALPKTFLKICKQLKKENLEVDFNQGLDHRLLTDEICQELFSLKVLSGIGGKIRFAFDDISYEPTVMKALRMLKKNGLKDWHTRWYVYVGVNDTLETVLHRVNILRDWKQAAFLMRDRDPKVQNNEEFKKVYVWTSQIAKLFSHVTFDDFLKKYDQLKLLRSGHNLLDIA
jgi:hypothetical protein